jgi:hypothetical protein
MFQVAHRPKQRSIEPARQAPTVAHAPAISVGKQSLTAQLEAGHLGAPDFYGVAIESARRELRAVRDTALPAFVAVLRRRDLAPLAHEIERTRVAMQVRYLLACANKHVFALEAAAVHRDPMVLYLRDAFDVQLSRAIALGVYRDVEHELPQRFVEEKPKQASKNPKTAQKPTRHKPATSRSTLIASKSAAVTRARTRLARGTGAPPDARPTAATPATQTSQPSAATPTSPRTAGIRPGFRT